MPGDRSGWSPPLDEGSNAYSVTVGLSFEAGRPTAQMTALSLPLDEIEVKKPESWPPEAMSFAFDDAWC
jgi:hypothetical protein